MSDFQSEYEAARKAHDEATEKYHAAERACLDAWHEFTRTRERMHRTFIALYQRPAKVEER